MISSRGKKHEVHIESGRHDPALAKQTDLFIALNARKSAEAFFRFKKTHPQTPAIVILTGTDINHRDVADESSATWQCLALADHLVALHEGSLDRLPDLFHEKCTVIYPSVKLPADLTHSPDPASFHLIMAGNFRPEKDLPTAMMAAGKISAPIHCYGDFSAFTGTCPGISTSTAPSRTAHFYKK